MNKFDGVLNKKYASLFKTEVFINQPRANLDEKSVFGKIAHYLNPEIWKMLVRGLNPNERSFFDSGPCFTYH